MFTAAIAIVAAANVPGTPAVVEGLKHELELLNKKSADGKGSAKHAAEVRANMDKVVTVLSDEGIRAADVGTLADFSIQRTTALLKKLVDSGEVVRDEVKKVAYFSLAE